MLTEKLNFLYRDIGDPGQYQGAFALGTVTKLGEVAGLAKTSSATSMSRTRPSGRGRTI